MVILFADYIRMQKWRHVGCVSCVIIKIGVRNEVYIAVA